MQILARNGYTTDQVKTALHAPVSIYSFRYDLLDNTNKFIRPLTNVKGGRVDHHTFREIKRTARFTLDDDGSINFLSDRIKPYVRLKMFDGGYAEFPVGVFILTTPPRKVKSSGSIEREVEAYDLTQILSDDKVVDRYTVTAGTNYITAVKALLDSAGITANFQNLTQTDAVLPNSRDWEPGTKKIDIVNDLLNAINYQTLWFDENGIAIAAPFVIPTTNASSYTYADDEDSVMKAEMTQNLDLFGIANKWVLVVSESDSAPMTSIYTNSNADSPTSTVARGRTIVDFRTYQEAVSQQVLDDRARRLAFNASQLYEHVNLETRIMPFHQEMDVVKLNYGPLQISDIYTIISWEFDLKAGAMMKHDLRKVVQI